MFNVKTQLADLQHTIADSNMVDMLLSSLPDLPEFECLKSSIWYGADPSQYTPQKVRELILEAAARQRKFRGKRGSKRGNQKGEGGKGADGKGANQQGKSNDSKKSRAGFTCGSTKHLKANCPERTNKQSDADDGEQKRRPRSYCTLLRDENPQTSPAHRGDDLGVVTGVAATEHEHAQVGTEPDGDRGAEDVDASLEVNNGDTGAGEADEFLVGDEQAAAEAELSAEEEPRAAVDAGSWWYFDTASNSHVTGNRSDFVTFTEDTTALRSIRGVSPSIASRIAGVGAVQFVTEVDGEEVVTRVDDVFYVPGAEFGLFSPGLAHEQGFEFEFDSVTRNFTISWEGRPVVVATPADSTWGFQSVYPSRGGDTRPEDQLLCNFTVADGVASLNLWHERL
ncbi:hypothetical protein PR003_g22023, partial [Phytophthora rubi]